MPELPEVEVVRRGVAPYLTGATLNDVALSHDRVARRYPRGSAGLLEDLNGSRIATVERRGKYLWATLEGQRKAILFHLGMSGQLLIDEGVPPARPHVRLVTRINDGLYLTFVDQRTFGYITIDDLVDAPGAAAHTVRLVPSLAAHIAPDLLEEGLDIPALARQMRRRRAAIKSVLLNQEIVSGIGNIYADEALWEAQVHGARLASGLSYAKLTEILYAARKVMQRALLVGGTSFDKLYVNAAGEPGYFARSLAAYGRAGKPCRRCQTLLERQVVAGRTHSYCPKCQKVPRRNR